METEEQYLNRLIQQATPAWEEEDKQGWIDEVRGRDENNAWRGWLLGAMFAFPIGVVIGLLIAELFNH